MSLPVLIAPAPVPVEQAGDERRGEENVRDREQGERIFSAYVFPEGKLWVITEYDRTATTVLLPSEY